MKERRRFRIISRGVQGHISSLILPEDKVEVWLKRNADNLLNLTYISMFGWSMKTIMALQHLVGKIIKVSVAE